MFDSIQSSAIFRLKNMLIYLTFGRIYALSLHLTFPQKKSGKVMNEERKCIFTCAYFFYRLDGWMDREKKEEWGEGKKPCGNFFALWVLAHPGSG